MGPERVGVVMHMMPKKSRGSERAGLRQIKTHCRRELSVVDDYECLFIYFHSYILIPELVPKMDLHIRVPCEFLPRQPSCGDQVSLETTV